MISKKDLYTFIEKYQNRAVGYLGYPGECLSSVKWFIKEIFGIDPPPSGVKAAWGYWEKFPEPLPSVLEKIEYTPGEIPQPGDIIVWRKTPRLLNGHIAICVIADTYGFIAFEQNWFSRKGMLVWHNYTTDLYGWLRGK